MLLGVALFDGVGVTAGSDEGGHGRRRHGDDRPRVLGSAVCAVPVGSAC